MVTTLLLIQSMIILGAAWELLSVGSNLLFVFKALGIVSFLVATVLYYAKPNQFLFRAIQLTFFSLILVFVYQSSKINHPHFIWILSGIIFFIFGEKTFEKKYPVQLIIRHIFAFYFCAGLWKLREFSFSSYDIAFLEILAIAYTEGNLANHAVLEFLNNFPQLGVIGLGLAIAFQISCLIPIFSTKLDYMWAGLAVSFHLASGIVLGIWFKETIIAIVFFVFIAKRKDTEGERSRQEN